MTATYRLRGLGWLAVCMIAALGFYLVSLQVASARNDLETVNRQIAQAHEDIRALQTEFSTRANLAQLERWNGEVLALAAPTPDQYLPNEQALAALDFNGPGDARVETAALVIPTLPTMPPPPDAVPEAGTPAPTQAANSPAPVMVAAAKPAEAHVVESPAAVAPAAPVRVAAVSRKAEAMAMLDRKLLSDSTLGDLMSGARAEAASLR